MNLLLNYNYIVIYVLYLLVIARVISSRPMIVIDRRVEMTDLRDD